MSLVAVALLVEVPDGEQLGTIDTWSSIGGRPLRVVVAEEHPDPAAIFDPATLRRYAPS